MLNSVIAWIETVCIRSQIAYLRTVRGTVNGGSQNYTQQHA